ncbi:MAG: YeeE/YedE family protein [Gammaproteobacteria bacterium]|nr:YeeE/YedE family protein [Gammaproteobacteria bacterium]
MAQKIGLLIAFFLLSWVVFLLPSEGRLLMLFAVALLMGLTLYHATFGFASAYRQLLLRGRVRGVMAHLLMLALATLLFAPILANGSVFDHGVTGANAPVALQVAVGALLFGIGMQLGNGCASGTLYAVGGGSPRMLLTLVSFVAGSFWASLHLGWWQALPSLGVVTLGDELGWPLAVAVQLSLLALIGWGLFRWGRQEPESEKKSDHFLSGPWPLLIGALLLALLNFAVLLIAGHPWSITWGFSLWGAKAAMLLGWQPWSSGFWLGGFQQAALERSLLLDETSLMNLGILLGAFLAAVMALRFKPSFVIEGRSLLAALIGGLLMGYGARIGFGCNIGAFFSGIASTSLHGWLWIVFALPGCWLGIQLRPRFGLCND